MITLKPEFVNDPFATAHAVHDCYYACFMLNECCSCPFYETFDTDSRSRSKCRQYLIDNAVMIHMDNLADYVSYYPERPSDPIGGDE